MNSCRRFPAPARCLSLSFILVLLCGNGFAAVPKVKREDSEVLRSERDAGDGVFPTASALRQGDEFELVIVQGDILQYRRRPHKANKTGQARDKRMIINDGYSYSGYLKWPYGIIPYTIDTATYTAAGYQKATQAIAAAMSDWSANTCVRFMTAGAQAQTLVKHAAYIRIYGGGNCWSLVGFYGDGYPQDLSLGESGCLSKGLAAHELGHAIGLVHEQSRPDRDGYVMALANNIQAGFASNFVKTPYPIVLTPTPYDLYSIMHYGSSDFSANGKATLIPQQPRLVNLLGNRQEISFYDYKAVNILYGCSGSCTMSCKNDGYPMQRADGSCFCVCPYGLGGVLCDSVQLPCGGGVIALDPSGTPVALASPNNPKSYPVGVVCGWLIKAPPGYVVKLNFTSFNVSASPWQCNHTLEIRSNLLGQPAPNRYCGVGIPDTVYSRYDASASAVLIILNASDTGSIPSTGFTAVASAYKDGCLTDPCRGAPCAPVPGSSSAYVCQPPKGNFICGLENMLSANCSSVRFDGSYTLFNGSGSPQMSWELFETTADLPAFDGGQYAASKASYHGPNGIKGYFRITPYAFAAGGRCLRFSYALTSVNAGTLSVYRAVNGLLGQPIFSTNGSMNSGSAWSSASLQIASTASPQDLVEIVFEAAHNLDAVDDAALIGVDGLRYSEGPCPTGPCSQDPCGTAPCSVLSSTSYSCPPIAVATISNAACGFESWEDCSSWLNYVITGDNYDWRTYPWPGPGVKWPRGTGAPGPAVGLNYLYGQLYDKPAGSKIWLRVYPFVGSRCLRFKYSMYGLDIATLTVYRSTGGVYPGAYKVWSITGNQGGGWRSAAVSISSSDIGSTTPFELTVEVVRGSTGYASDYALDDFVYTSGLCV